MASRPLLVDLLWLAVATEVLLVGTSEAATDQVPPREALDGLSFGILLVSSALFLLRRHAPLALFGLQTILAGIYLARGYPYGPLLFAVAVAAYLAATHCQWSRVRALGGVAAAALAAAAVLGHRPVGLVGWAVAVGQAGWAVVPVMIGRYVRTSREATARAEREARQRQIDQERLRLAREVHDVVGHSLSVISLQAGVALHVLARRPEQAQPALEAIRRTSADALAELRSTLALTRLGDDATALHRAPSSALLRVDALVAEVERCGLRVQVERSGRVRLLPGEIDLATFRVIQESLTNVLRHAGATRASVRLLYEPEHVRVVVEDDGTGRAAGDEAQATTSVTVGNDSRGHASGLAGLRERVQSLGGRLKAGPCARGWRVEAVLPTGVDEGRQVAVDGQSRP